MLHIENTPFLHLVFAMDLCWYLKRSIVEDHPMNIPVKFVYNVPSGFGKDWNVNSYGQWPRQWRTQSGDKQFLFLWFRRAKKI